jgi:hypothetical protein
MPIGDGIISRRVLVAVEASALRAPSVAVLNQAPQARARNRAWGFSHTKFCNSRRQGARNHVCRARVGFDPLRVIISAQTHPGEARQTA